MWKALLHKQFMELTSWVMQSSGNGRRRPKAAVLAISLGISLLVILLAVGWFFVGRAIYSTASLIGVQSLYLLGAMLFSLLIVLVSCAFCANATLFHAKDTAFLLSLPIPPTRILLVRLLGLWTISLADHMLFLFPALLAMWIYEKASWLHILMGLLVLLSLSVVALLAACALSWAVAKISVHIRHKSLVAIALFLLLMGFYLSLMLRMEKLMGSLVFTLIRVIRRPGSLLAWLIRLCSGEPLPAVLFALGAALLLALTCLLLSRSLLQLGSADAPVSKAPVRMEASRQSDLFSALLAKEWRRFFASPIYVLNGSIASVLMLVCGIALLFKGQALRQMLTFFSFGSSLPHMIVCAILCLAAGLNTITAPSISLEGKTLWLLQSLPVPPAEVLRAKFALHLILTQPAVLFLSICAVITFHPGVSIAMGMLFLPQLFTLLCAALGLCMNLKAPNLEWTSETVPVKQGLSVTLTILSCMATLLLLGGLYWIVRSFILPQTYLALCACLLVCALLCLLHWLKTRGAEIFLKL